MKVGHSGWSKEYGSFSYEIFIDENKTDYELHFKNGSIGRQCSEFREETRDWNCDNHVYTQYGAWFEYFDKYGERDGTEFWTPENMVRVAIDAKEKGESRLNGNEVISIPGIQIPDRDKRLSLKEQVARSERQRMAQDIERNRKMNALGIRDPREPWAR